MKSGQGETIFGIEACARVPTYSLYIQGSTCTVSVNLDPSRVSPACQAEENVVCNFNCVTTRPSLGTNNLRGSPNLLEFNRYLEGERVDPAEYELVTIASCTGHSFVITREIPEGESEDIDYLTVGSYAKYGLICHGTYLYNDQSILRNGLDVDYGVRILLDLQMLARRLLHCCRQGRPMLKSPPSTRPKTVLKSAPSTLTRAPPPVERCVVQQWYLSLTSRTSQ